MVSATAPVFLATGPANLSTGTFPSLGGLRFVISAGPARGYGDRRRLRCAALRRDVGRTRELRAVEPSIGGLEVGIIGAFACAISDPGAFAEIKGPARHDEYRRRLEAGEFDPPGGHTLRKRTHEQPQPEPAEPSRSTR